MHHSHVDRILHIDIGRCAHAVKCVSLRDAALGEHFPGNPVLPGVFLLEGIAQTAGVLLWKSTEEKRLAVLASVDRARFLGFARPGDSLALEVDIEHLASDHARVVGHAIRGGCALAHMRMTFRLVEPHTLIDPYYLPAFRQVMETWMGHYPSEPRA
jgi:3-hydroxyacyl-[acyl-carrier-protein] dehydratase